MAGAGEHFEEHLDLLRALEDDVRGSVPPDLLATMLQAATTARPPAMPHAPVGTPAALLVEVSEALDAELATFDEREWSALALVGWSVRDTVAHLAAVHEVLVSRLLGRDDAPITHPELHVATEQVVDELRAASYPAARDRWARSVTQLRHGTAVADTPIEWLGLVVPAEKVIVDRAFETWIHADDIRRATGRPTVDPSDPHLRLLCDLAVELLPVGLLLTERPHDAVVTVELTGPGGGTWTMPLGSGAANGVELALRAPARELCLLMGDRLDVADLRWTAQGDARADAVMRDLMAAAPVFARP